MHAPFQNPMVDSPRLMPPATRSCQQCGGCGCPRGCVATSRGRGAPAASERGQSEIPVRRSTEGSPPLGHQGQAIGIGLGNGGSYFGYKTRTYMQMEPRGARATVDGNVEITLEVYVTYIPRTNRGIASRSLVEARNNSRNRSGRLTICFVRAEEAGRKPLSNGLGGWKIGFVGLTMDRQ